MRGFTTLFHEVCFILLLTVGKVPLTGLLVEFSAAPFALDAVITLEVIRRSHVRLKVLRAKAVSSFRLRVLVGIAHCLAELHTLLFPLGDLLAWKRFLLCLFGHTAFFYRKGLRVLLAHTCIFNSFGFALLLHIKFLSLLGKDFLADLDVLF